MNAQSKIEASVAPAVYSKIAAVQGELAKVGIAKSGRNQQQGYNFRGIDAVYAALSPLLAQHGLIIIPRMIERNCVEGQTKKGDPLFRVTVHAEFDFVAADDGSKHTASTYGEAMDSADKATNKAMSAAYKYAAFMTFAIPTEGDNDADAHTPDVAAAGSSRDNSEARQVSPTGPAPTDQGRINEEQITRIQMLLKATKIDEVSFCRMMKAPEGARLFQLPQARFGAAVEMLNEKLAAMAKQKTNGAVTDFGEVLADEIPY